MILDFCRYGRLAADVADWESFNLAWPGTSLFLKLSNFKPG